MSRKSILTICYEHTLRNTVHHIDAQLVNHCRLPQNFPPLKLRLI